MRYEMMFPDQIRKAIKESWPLVIPVGVLEYHAEHCVVGVDTILVVEAVKLLEDRLDMVVFPPFHFGAASYAVGPPEANGTIQIRSSTIYQLARDLFHSLFRVGFRNIHLFIHHQSENFFAGMPTDLALRSAARDLIFEHLEQTRGEGWWGSNDMSDYYAQHETGDDPFNWIKVHPFMNEETQKLYPVDHASLQETSLMLAFCPEGVDMSRFSDEKWFCREATKANLEYGNAAKEMILEGMLKVLRPTKEHGS